MLSTSMASGSEIVLDSEMQRRARAKAAQLGVPLTEYVRRLVARDLAQDDRLTDPSLVFDLGSSDGSDVAQNKDQMLGEALAARR
jgi:hypothetical protein